MIKEIMYKIKDIFINSLIPNNKFYKTILKKKFIQSFLYFFLFLFILNLLMFIVFVIKINNRLNVNTFKQSLNQLDKLPKNLIININNKHLSTNQDKPVLIWTNNKNLLGVIDETSSNEKINIYNSRFLLTSTSLVIKQMTKEFINIPYSNTNIKITKDNIIKVKSAILNITPYIIGLISFYFIILNPIFLLMFLSIFLLFISFVAFFIYKSKIKKITFLKTFQVSLHAITLPVLIYSLLITFDNLFLFILNPFIFLLLSFAFILISLYDAYK